MKHIWLQIALAAGLVASIAIGIELSRPLRATREPVAAQIAAHRYIDSSDESVVARALLATAQASDTTKSVDSTNADSRTPWASSPTDVALNSPQFFHDRDSFAMDLVRTGRVDPDRARSLADVAVREAYTRKIPPALVLGVMMTENDAFKSTARSNVGAVGLMQIMPKIWTSTLGRKFGTNLRADSTNLKYGIWILGWLADADEQDRRRRGRRLAARAVALQRLCHRQQHAELSQVSRRRATTRRAVGQDDLRRPDLQGVRRRAHVGVAQGRRRVGGGADAVTSALVAEHLGKSFGDVVALVDVSLDVPQRAAVALVGESGSGKTTLLRCFNRLIEPDQGSISDKWGRCREHRPHRASAADRLRPAGRRPASTLARAAERRACVAAPR